MSNRRSLYKVSSLLFIFSLLAVSAAPFDVMSDEDETPECGEWKIESDNSDDDRLNISLGRNNFDEYCSAEFSIENDTGTFLGGGYSLEMNYVGNFADIYFPNLKGEYLVPGLTIDMVVSPLDPTRQANVRVQGEVTLSSYYARDLAFYLLWSIIEIIPIPSNCLISYEEISKISIQTAPILENAVNLAFSAKLTEARDEFAKVIDVFIERVGDYTREIGLSCFGEVIEKEVGEVAVKKAKLIKSFLTWVPVLTFDYLKYDDHPAVVNIYYVTEDGSEVETVVPTVDLPTQESNFGTCSSIVSEKDGMELMYMPAGEFLMGSEEDGNIHAVYLDAFWIDRTEVTNDMFRRFVNDTKYLSKAEKVGGSYALYGWTDGAYWQSPQGPESSISGLGNHPVVHVSWKDASNYCQWAGRQLPTNEEWEKAARGVDGRTYPWGNESPDGSLLNFSDKNSECPWADKSIDDGYGLTSPVGNYPKGESPYCVLDLAGNALEWCEDWGGNDKGSFMDLHPSVHEGGDLRSVRGGSLCYPATGIYSYFNSFLPSMYTDYELGFRCVLSAVSPMNN